MAARSKARKRALDILFEAERAVSEPERQASWLYAREIVDGIVDHRDEIDELITTHSRGWTLERMPAVDRAILRIGTYEVVYADDIPDGVAISEAVSLATSLSTDDSPGFVNGLLARLAEIKPTLV